MSNDSPKSLMHTFFVYVGAPLLVTVLATVMIDAMRSSGSGTSSASTSIVQQTTTPAAFLGKWYGSYPDSSHRATLEFLSGGKLLLTHSGRTFDLTYSGNQKATEIKEGSDDFGNVVSASNGELVVKFKHLKITPGVIWDTKTLMYDVYRFQRADPNRFTWMYFVIGGVIALGILAAVVAATKR